MIFTFLEMFLRYYDKKSVNNRLDDLTKCIALITYHVI